MRVLKNKNLLIPFISLLFIFTFQTINSKAQTIEILGGNTLNGAVNGAMLGGATMALKNSNDFAPLRVGVGAGTLYGLSVGIYDISQASKGQQYFVSGTFNDGNNSTIIVLLDTFYGAAGGAIVAASFNLISNEAIESGLQYGSGVGAWVGFGFGLLDAFILSERVGDFTSSTSAASESHSGGIVTIDNQNQNYRINLLNPTIYSQTEINSSAVSVKNSVALDIINFQIPL